MFSKSCEYGLRAAIYIASNSIDNQTIGLNNIAEAIDSPNAFTAKILQQLTRSNIIKSIKGPRGGFIIEPTKMQTKLNEIVNVFDGNTIYTGCGLGLHQCDAKNPCPLHDEFVVIRKKLKDMLETNTLERLLQHNEIRNLLLKR